MPPTQALILFAHGSRQTDWREPFERVRAMVQRNGVRVELAFLEMMSPSLPEVLAACMADGVGQIQIVPMFFGVGVHVGRDLQAIIAQYPQLNISVAPALGQNEAVLQAMANYALVTLNP